MGSVCFTSFHGRRMRLTRVDSCGRPVYGVCAQVVTKGFVSVEMTGEIEEGDELTQKNAAGELCISEKGADELKWLNVNSTFCEVDPDIMALFNPTWTKLLDYKGDAIGWAESSDQDLSQGLAMELWADVSGEDICDDPNATGSWVYFLVPFIVGGTMGDQTVENAVLTTSLTARTKRNSKWGLGPYDVMLNGPIGAPVPGPLLVPVGSREPRRRFLTTVPPPDPACGCQPLSNPDGPTLTVVEGATSMTAEAERGAETGTYKVNWGDGSAEVTLAVSPATVTHLYSTAGTYHVALYKDGEPTNVTVQTITVPF